MATPPPDRVRANADVSPERKVEEQIASVVREMIALGDQVLTIIAAGRGKRGETKRGSKPGVHAFYSHNDKLFILMPTSPRLSASISEAVAKRVKEYYEGQPGYRVTRNHISVTVEF